VAIETYVENREHSGNRLPGRPRTFDTDRVIDAVLELFWKRGYRATTTRDLEDTLGLSQSSIYNAFGSKSNLLEVAMDRYEALTSQELVRPLEKSKEGLKSLETFFTSLGHWVTHKGRRGCMLINMMAEDGGDNEAISRRTQAYRDRVRLALRKALSRAARKGETTRRGLDARTEVLLGLILGLNITARGGGGEAELEGLLKAIRSQLRSWRVESTA
jgi:TetR/AcrR family transcriptional repressor of nem operon